MPPTNIDSWTRSIRMTSRSQLLFDKSFFNSLENQGRESILLTHNKYGKLDVLTALVDDRQALEREEQKRHSNDRWKRKWWGSPNTKRNHANDPLEVSIGPLTRARAKKLKEALNELVQNIWSKMDLEELGTSKEHEGQPIIHLI